MVWNNPKLLESNRIELDRLPKPYSSKGAWPIIDLSFLNSLRICALKRIRRSNPRARAKSKKVWVASSLLLFVEKGEFLRLVSYRHENILFRLRRWNLGQISNLWRRIHKYGIGIVKMLRVFFWWLHRSHKGGSCGYGRNGIRRLRLNGILCRLRYIRKGLGKTMVCPKKQGNLFVSWASSTDRSNNVPSAEAPTNRVNKQFSGSCKN